MRKPTLKELKRLKKLGFKIKPVNRFLNLKTQKNVYNMCSFKTMFVFKSFFREKVIIGYDKHGNENVYSIKYLYQKRILR